MHKEIFFLIYHYEISLELNLHQRLIWPVVWQFLPALFSFTWNSTFLIAWWGFFLSLS